MQAAIDIGTLIVKNPGVCGSRPRIAGTCVTVQNIAIDFNAGMTLEEIVAQRTHLTLRKFMQPQPTTMPTKRLLIQQ